MEGFEIGETSVQTPTPLHINFSIQKADTSGEQNVGRISVWNLNDEHLSMLHEKDCIVTLRAGYGSHMPLIFVGAITFVETAEDGADRETKIEASDGRIAIRDSYISVSYSGNVSTKKVIDDVITEMGVSLAVSHNAEFDSLPNGFSYVGKAAGALDKLCATNGHDWQIQNGVLNIKNRCDTMTREAYLISPETGLVGIPKKIMIGQDGKSDGQPGYEVVYLLNGAIGIGDYIRLESSKVQGYFRIHTVEHSGDSNGEGGWVSQSQILEVT